MLHREIASIRKTFFEVIPAPILRSMNRTTRDSRTLRSVDPST